MKTIILKTLIALSLFSVVAYSYGQLTINEFQASNKKTLRDGSWNYPDWIELKNSSATDIDLSGYFLSDDFELPEKWQLPAGIIIPANGYLVFFASGENNDYHTNFKLSSFGEEIIFSNADTNLIDTITFESQYQDYSFGRNGSNEWVYFSSPTPNLVNDYASAFTNYIEGPTISLSSGIYTMAQTVSLSSSIGADIYYTLDGSLPSVDPAYLYTGPININTTSVLKTITSNTDGISLVNGASYIIGASHSLPVIIMTSGNDRAEWVSKESGKYDMDGRIRFTYFTEEGEKVLDQYALFRKSGGMSSSMPQLNGKVRPAFTTKSFDYNFFKNKTIKKNIGFLIRNASQDNRLAHMRDAVVSRIIGNDNITDGFYFEGYQPAVIYVDGIYEGVVHIREDDDNAFFQNNFPNDLVHSIQKKYSMHLNTHHYDYSGPLDRADQQGLLNIHDVLTVVHMNHFLQCGEWEHWISGQIEGRTPSIIHFIHDADYALGAGNSGHSIYQSIKKRTQGWSDIGIPANIMSYAPYKEESAQFSCAFYSLVLDTNRVLDIVKNITNAYTGEMDATANVLINNSSLDPMPGWAAPFYTNEAEWLRNVDTLKMNIRLSTDSIFDWLSIHYGYTDLVTVQLETSSIEQGHIRAHGIKATQTMKNATFFADLPLQLQAIPEPGFMFSHWEGDVSGTNANISPIFASNATAKAVFVPIAFTAHNLHINEIQAVNLSTVTDEQGEFDDWIEIYNQESSTVDLAGYYVTDDICNLRKWKIRSDDPMKTSVDPGSWILLWADSDTTQGPNHLNFKLDNSESFTLTYPDGITVVDQIHFNLSGDQSYGSEIDGALTDIIFDTPTPGASNNTDITAVTNVHTENEFDVFPNPTTGLLYLPSDDEYILTNLQGVQVLEGCGKKIELSILGAGIYILSQNNSLYRIIKK